MKPIEPGLKIVFVIGAISSLVTGGLSVLAPTFVTSISGLDPAAQPAIQQTGAATLGYFVMLVLALRATIWDQVRLVVAGSLVYTALSTLGSIYYIFLVGVMTSGLFAILIASVILTVGYGYYMFKYSRDSRNTVPAAGHS